MINEVEYLLTLSNGLPILSWSEMSPHIEPEPCAHLISSIGLFFLCQGVLLEHGQFPWKQLPFVSLSKLTSPYHTQGEPTEKSFPHLVHTKSSFQNPKNILLLLGQWMLATHQKCWVLLLMVKFQVMCHMGNCLRDMFKDTFQSICKRGFP